MISSCFILFYLFFHLKNKKKIYQNQNKVEMHRTGLNDKPAIVDYMISLGKVYSIITSMIEARNDSSEAQAPTMKWKGGTDVSGGVGG